METKKRAVPHEFMIFAICFSKSGSRYTTNQYQLINNACVLQNTMTTKNAKTMLFGSLLAILALSLGGINFAQVQETMDVPTNGNGGSLGGINFAQVQELTAEQEAQIDETGKQIVQLQQDNIKYEQLPDTPEKAELISIVAIKSSCKIIRLFC